MKDSFCRACGRVIEDINARFCGYCGTYALAFRMPRILRCDGVYATKPETDRGIIIRRCLRFYPDGFVIGIVFGSRQDAGVATWWGRRINDGMKGYYNVNARNIEFACTASWGTTVYVGTIRKDGLRITSANGKPCSTFYRFFSGEEGVPSDDSPEVSSSLSVHTLGPPIDD